MKVQWQVKGHPGCLQGQGRRRGATNARSGDRMLSLGPRVAEHPFHEGPGATAGQPAPGAAVARQCVVSVREHP